VQIVDSIAGVKGADLVNGTSTLCFPSTACMGSTWNRELLFEVGAKLALQAKSKSAQVILGPVLNLHRDPRGGRNFESFGEDPLLAGELGAALTNGIQSNGIAACPKHFIGNECETKRREQNVAESINGRSMREIYLASYQTLFRNSNPMAIMMA
jgi:beta-glucosidase